MPPPNSHPVSVSYVVKSQAGARRRLPTRVITRGEWSAVRYGGFADFTLETSAAFSDLASIVATDILEVSLNGVLAYRGEVTSRRRVKGEPDTLTLSGYGRMLRVGRHFVQKRYAKYGGLDIALQFRDMAKDWVQPFEAGLSVRVLPVGQTVDLFDAWGQKVKDATDTLIGLAANGAVWGCDVITDPTDPEYLADRLFMQPVSAAADWVLPASSRVTTAAESEDNSEQIVNALYVFGGPPKYPNLLYNGDFERPTFAGNGLGNLLQNPGFEGGGTNWGLGAGASVKAGGHLEGATFSGGNMVELDHVGENVSQTTAVACPPNRDIIYATHARRELQDVPVSGTMTLDFLDGSGATLATDTLTPVAPASTLWDYFYKPVRSPAGTAHCRLTVTLDSISTPGHGGLLLDDLEVYDAGNVLQDRWTTMAFGEATVTAQNWLYPDAYHGGYSVFLQQTSLDIDGHDMHLGLTNGGRLDITPDESIQFGVWLKLPPGVTTCAKMLLEIHSYDGSGKDQGFPTKQVIAPQSWAGWKFFSATHGFAGDSARAEVYLTFRGAGAIIADAFCVRDAAAYTTDAEFFIPDGPFQTVIRAADVFAGDASALGVAVAGSAAKYGESADVVNETSLTNQADAVSYARSVFLARALPPLAPTVERIDDARPFRPGQGVVLAGADGQILEQQQTLPIVKVTWTHSGPLRVKIQTERELPDPGANILQQIQKRLAMGGLTSGGGSGGTSAGSSGATGPQPAPLTVGDGTTTVPRATVITFSGATVTADAVAGTADVAITGSSDHKVINDAGDTSPDYLAAKVESSATLGWSQDAANHKLIGTVPVATGAALGVVRGGGTGNCAINADGSIQAPVNGAAETVTTSGTGSGSSPQTGGRLVYVAAGAGTTNVTLPRSGTGPPVVLAIAAGASAGDGIIVTPLSGDTLKVIASGGVTVASSNRSGSGTSAEFFDSGIGTWYCAQHAL